MKIYHKNKKRNFAVISIAVWSLFLGAQLMAMILDRNYSLFNSLWNLLLPVLSLIMYFFIYFRPYLEITDNQIVKYDFFERHTININEIEYIKNKFGDMHVKGPDKIIAVSKDHIDEADKEKLLEILEKRTELKLA